MKPLLLSSTGNGTQTENVKQEINEWQDLIMDTYLKLKEDSSSKGMGDLSLNRLPTINNQGTVRKNTSVSILDQQNPILNAGSSSDSRSNTVIKAKT